MSWDSPFSQALTLVIIESCSDPRFGSTGAAISTYDAASIDLAKIFINTFNLHRIFERSQWQRSEAEC